ncbi:hypothetical protein Tco_1128811, partial [Tanacetum coccineum]
RWRRLFLSPAGVLDLVIHSTSETDSSEDSLSTEHAPVAPAVSPFLFSDQSELDSESEPPMDAFERVASERPLPLDSFGAVVVRHRTRMTMRKSVKGYRHVMTPARSKALRLLRDSALTRFYKTSSSDPSSHSSDSLSSSDTAHTPLGPLPYRRPQCSYYVTPSSPTSA